jgi:uroporphyrinogen-III synthase
MRSGARWVIVGTVATTADRPLVGMGVVVTRDDGDSGVLSRALRARGATVLHWPTVRWAPAADPAPLTTELGRLSTFHWVVFTSPRAVDAVAERRDTLPEALRVAAVGRSTAEAARLRGWRIDLVPGVQTAEALAQAMTEAGAGAGNRVLFPASEIAGVTLEEGLGRAGAEVVRVTAYRTVPVPIDRAACGRALRAGAVQVISFTSPSAVSGLAQGLGDSLFTEAVASTVMAAIGPTTAGALRSAGADRVIEAEDHSLTGLADRIAEWARAHHRKENG